MSDLALNDSHDLEPVNNEIILIEGLEAKTQKLKQKYKTFLGEWFLETSMGVPWIQKIFTKQVNTSEVDAILKGVILSSEDVIELLSFNLDLDSNRRLNLTFQVRFDEGVATISEVI